MQRLLVILFALAVCSGTAAAARLPGVRTPSKNISCFYVPAKGTAPGYLLCAIKQATYAHALQSRCSGPPTGLDWHGFMLAGSRKGELLCTGGIMYDPRDKPTYAALAYGKSWRRGSITCTSRSAGLTCTSTAGHGLFLSRASWRTW